MHISLTPKLEQIVKSKVDSGFYNNASEVIREALRKMFLEDEADKRKLRLLKKSLAAGIAQADMGKCNDYSIKDIIDDLDTELGD